MMELWVSALALMLILEGILPFTAPKVWREMFHRITELNDGQLRFAGLASMLVGLVLLFLAQRQLDPGK